MPQRKLQFRVLLYLLALGTLAPAALAAGPRRMPTFDVGAKVDVRVKMAWVAAKVLAREENIYQVQFLEQMAVAEAWVPASIMRAKGDRFDTAAMVLLGEGKPSQPTSNDVQAIAAAKAGTLINPYEQSRPEREPARKTPGRRSEEDKSESESEFPTFVRNQRVEVRNTRGWKAAKVLQRDGNIYQIEFPGPDSVPLKRRAMFAKRRWVQCIVMRRLGSKVELSGHISLGLRDEKPAQPTQEDLKRARAGGDYLFGEWREPRGARGTSSPASAERDMSNKERFEQLRAARQATLANRGHPDLPGMEPEPSRVFDGSPVTVPGSWRMYAEPMAIIPHADSEGAIWQTPDGASKALSPQVGAWTYEPIAAVAPAEISRPVSLAPELSDKMDNVASLRVVGATAPIAVVARDQPFEDRSVIEFVDVKAGKSLGIAVLPDRTELGDLSPSGKRVALTRSALEGWTVCVLERRENQLHVLVDGPPDLGSHHMPHGGIVRFVDDEHLLVMGSGNTLQLWRLHERGGELVYTISLRGKRPARQAAQLLANRRHVVICEADGILLLDALTGKALGHIPLESSPSDVDVSPDGSQLICVAGEKQLVFRLRGVEDGALWPRTLPDVIDGATWLTNQLLLGSDGRVYAVNTGVPLWRWHGVSIFRSGGRQQLGVSNWFVTDRSSYALRCEPLVNETMTGLASTVTRDRYEAAKDLKLTIKSNIGHSDWDRRAKKSITDRARKAGFEVGAGHSRVLHIYADEKTTRPIEVRGPMAGPNARHTVTEFALRWVIKLDGEVIRTGPTQQIGMGRSRMIEMKRGQTFSEWFREKNEEQFKKFLSFLSVSDTRDLAIIACGGQVRSID